VRPNIAIRCNVLSALLAAICAGCSQPSGPSPVVGPPLYSVTGVVSEMTSSGPVPVAGIKVEDPVSRNSSSTDGYGQFRLALTEGVYALQATGPQFEARSQTVTVAGNIRLDIQMTRRVSFTLSGRVSEDTGDGKVPIEGVEIYCDTCGPGGHSWADTDRDGLFSLFDVAPGNNPIFVRKTGYVLLGEVDQYGRKRIVVTQDMQVDISMAKP
jgi:hypothetical protein